jgi:hypothetical protein
MRLRDVSYEIGIAAALNHRHAAHVVEGDEHDVAAAHQPVGDDVQVVVATRLKALLARQRHRLAGGNMHRQVLGQRFVAAHDVYQYANLGAAMHIAREFALGLDARKPADRQVLAEAAHQRGAGLFHADTVQRKRRQRRHVGWVTTRHELGQPAYKAQKVVIPRHEVGLAVDLHYGTQLGA